MPGCGGDAVGGCRNLTIDRFSTVGISNALDAYRAFAQLQTEAAESELVDAPV
jgi:hypothetical protein